MSRTTPSLRSGSRWRLAARRSLSSKSRSSEKNASWRSMSLSSFSVPFFLGGVGFPTEGTQGVACDQREAGVAVGGLLTGLDDDPSRLKLNQGVVGLALVHRDVDDQAGRVLVVQ